jgi:hypothetical protein
MKLKFFMCNKCDEYYAGYTDKENILCGALIGFTSKDGEDVPVGCGGKLTETTECEATEAAYRRRDNE